jgi:tetratricopeptide (TPR) repeat protein
MLIVMIRIVLLAALALPATALAQPAAAPAPGAARPPAAAEGRAPAALLAEVDAAYKERDAPGAMERMGAKLEDAEKRWPGDYDVLWRLARHYFWLSDAPDLEKKEKSRLGKIAWQFGDRATAANPARVEGWNYAAAGMGNYALGIGVISALRQGIEGKFKERLQKAGQIQHDFEHGAIHTAWGRFWYELPWPKYSASRSRASLTEALRLNPDNVRAHVYLADLYVKEDEPDKARAELEKAVANPPGRYDPPEERRWQAVARRMLAGK